MAFQLSDTANKDKVFLVKRSELEGRLDCEYYNPAHYRDLALLDSSPYSTSKLKNVCSRIVDGPFGSAIKADDYVENGIPFIRVADVTHGEGTIKNDNLIFISHEAHQEISRSKVVPGDVVIAKTGATMGAASVVPDFIPEANIRGDLAALSLLTELCSAEYAITYINTPIGQRLFWRLDSGGTRGRVVIGNLKKYPVVIPPLDIQNQIVAKMNTTYAAKKQKEALALQLLDSIDSYLLQELGIELPAEEENSISQRMFVRKFSEVSGGRFDPFFHIPYLVELDTLFKSKSLNSLRYYANSYASGATPSKDESEIHYTTSDKGIPFIRVQNLSVTGELQLTDLVYISHETHNGLLNRSKVFEGDLLVKITGVGRMAVASVAPKGFEGNINQHVVVIRTGSMEISRWLATFINLSSVEKIASKRATGGTRPALDYPALFSLPIIFPPLEKQNEIAAHIQTIRDQAKQLRAEAAAGLENAKQEVEAMILGKDSNQ